MSSLRLGEALNGGEWESNRADKVGDGCSLWPPYPRRVRALPWSSQAKIHGKPLPLFRGLPTPGWEIDGDLELSSGEGSGREAEGPWPHLMAECSPPKAAHLSRGTGLCCRGEAKIFPLVRNGG